MTIALSEESTTRLANKQITKVVNNTKHICKLQNVIFKPVRVTQVTDDVDCDNHQL